MRVLAAGRHESHKPQKCPLDNARSQTQIWPVASIVLQRASKIFDTLEGPAVALNRVDLELASGQFVVLYGPSGSGKTTLLRIIAGLESLTEGTLKIAGQDMANVPPHARNIAMVFQSPALYPHMTARENMEFGLKIRGCPAGERRRRIETVSEILEIAHLLERRPFELSGGQRQRVALGRAWVRQPDVFLLDEPFTSLDPRLRSAFRDHLKELHSSLQSTIILVSHDPDDLAAFGAKPLEMDSGRIIRETATACAH